MVFRAKGARTFKLKVAIEGRAPRTFSTGTTDEATAKDVEAMVTRMKARRQFAPLIAVFDDRVTLARLYDADVSGTVDELMRELADVDIEPLVAEWAAKANAKYVRQVRALIVEGERFPASAFRRKRISEFLAGLSCSGPTKNRYRSALSVFAKWLVEREVIESNPVRDVAMQKEHEPRMHWITWKQARALADSAPKGYRELFGIMAATGIELGAALRLTRASIDKDARTIHAQGSKTSWRNRVVKYEEWADGFVSGACSGRVGSALLFPAIRHADALDEFKRAQEGMPFSGHRLHDLRHTYAVNALKKGYKPTVVAHQLGHKDATMVTKVYGRFIPDAADYDVSTNPATSTSRTGGTKRG